MNAKRFNNLIEKRKLNVKAFEELYEFYYPKIVIHIHNKFRNKNFCQDVAQEFFTKLLKIEIKSYIEFPISWIYVSCDNIAKDFLKKEEYYRLAYADEKTTKSDVLFENVIFGEYLKQLEKLDKETREIIYLCGYEGYSLREIAEKMDINYNTVRQKYSRGIKKVNKF